MVREQITQIYLSGEQISLENFHFGAQNPLPEEELLPTTQKLLAGEIINWVNIETSDFLRFRNDKNHPLKRFRETLSATNYPVSEQVFSLLADDLNQYKVNTDLLRSDKLSEYWHKLTFYMEFPSTINLRKKLGDQIPEQAERFVQDVTKSVEELARALYGLDMTKDLKTMCKFTELYLQENIVFNLQAENPFSLTFAPNFKNPVAEMYGEHRTLDSMFKVAVLNNEHRIFQRNDWSWKQMREALEIYSSLGKQLRNMIGSLVVINIEILNKKIGIDLDVPKVDEFPINGFVDLLSFNMKNLPESAAETKHLLASYFPDTPIKLAEIIPAAAIYLLEFYEKSTNIENFKQLLDNIQAETIKYRNLTSPWILTLLRLAENEKLIPTISELILKHPHIPERVKNIIGSKIPGKIWFTKEGQIHATHAKADIPRASLIYTSQAQDVVEEPEIVSTTPFTESQEAKIPENFREASINAYDFISDIGILENEDTLAYIQKLNDSLTFYEADLMEKALLLQEEFKGPTENKTYVYYSKLYSTAPMREARKLGIESVIISGNVITFVINNNILYSNQNDRIVPVAFTGIMDENGWLVLDAQEESSQDNATLTLNNIALELIKEQSEKPDQTDDNKKSTRDAIGEWNRTKPDNLPRLKTVPDTNSDVQIAVRIGNQTVFIQEA